MLLRRVIEHVKAQDWNAIAIDFIIVVIGVFLGLQAQQWYSERERKLTDAHYIERLHGEVVELIKNREELFEPRARNVADIRSASAKLFGRQAATSLTMEECAAIQLSHIYTKPTTAIPTIGELLSAGRLDSLSSAEVRKAITRYTQSAARAEDLVAAVNTGALILPREYPELIALDGEDQRPLGLIFDTPSPRCDLDAMRKNQAFLNDFADNRNRFETYYRISLADPNERLKELHAALDRTLEIEHPAK
jgi:hypothetical protein